MFLTLNVITIRNEKLETYRRMVKSFYCVCKCLRRRVTFGTAGWTIEDFTDIRNKSALFSLNYFQQYLSRHNKCLDIFYIEILHNIPNNQHCCRSIRIYITVYCHLFHVTRTIC